MTTRKNLSLVLALVAPIGPAPLRAPATPRPARVGMANDRTPPGTRK